MGYKKLIQSGLEYEYFSFEKDLPVFNKLDVRKERVFGKQKDRRKDNLYRLCNVFRRIVQSNLVGENPLFFTLTFRDSLSLKEGYYCLKLFHLRMRYEFGSDFRFIVVPEFGSKQTKRLHFHGLYWGLDSSMGTVLDVKTHKPLLYGSERVSRRLARLWSYGWLDVIQTDGSFKLAYYLSKYLRKGLQSSFLMKNKSYVCSRNIKRPVIISSLSHGDLWGKNHVGWSVDTVFDQIQAVDNLCLTQQKEFDTMFLGRCLYKKYI